MSIQYDEDTRVFKLDSKRSSYVIALCDTENFIGHAYYGKRLSDYHLPDTMRVQEAPFVPSQNNRDRISFLDTFPMEYPSTGIGDYRKAAISVRSKDGFTGSCFTYKTHRIYKGKPALSGLPATFGGEDACTSLEIYAYDTVLDVEVLLLYTVFEQVDVITRSVTVKNYAYEPVYLDKVLSVSIDMDNQDYELLTLHGSWARERHIERRGIGRGITMVASNRGEGGHQEHPFMAVLEKTATQESGQVYGFHFVYSGSFTASVERNQFDQLRCMMGINPETFCWKLLPGQVFTAPEVVMVYSDGGLGQMTRSLHDLYRNHLIRGKYKDTSRPILINNWEATYFNFDTPKLLQIAENAAKLGIEMLVMDDGWFGKRNDDNTSLGDWFVNEEKLGGGLKELVDGVNALGLKFGIWFEPEMCSPDSDLYRQHPDWVIQMPSRTPGRARNQLVLDLTRREVLEHVYLQLSNILKSANIEYVKWDMNRPLSDLGGAMLTADTQGELSHRYMLAVYELQERLITDFPALLLENCSGGGARFDPGMLYYSPQIWCSDDTDAVERLSIQEGTAMLYPLSAIGAHVSDCPNHIVGRSTPFETRGYVALAGTFGYELDVTKISEADQACIPQQVAMYHRFNELIRTGDYYRLASYSENHTYDCWQIVSKDKQESLITFIQVLAHPSAHSIKIYPKGLCDKLFYRHEEAGVSFAGDVIMQAGLNITKMYEDYTGKLIYLRGGLKDGSK